MPDGDNGLISNHIIEYIIGYKKQKYIVQTVRR